MRFSSSRFLLLGSLFLAAACTAAGDSRAPGDCNGGKCDTPSDPAETSCLRREADAMSTSQPALTPTAIRWACSDVEGVNTNNNDDRGQEYCEYFAIVQPPPQTEGGAAVGAVVLGQGSNPLSLELNEAQVFALEDQGSAVAGQCVFTSWHPDTTGALPCEATSSCPSVLGFSVSDASLFRMQLGFNSNGAASSLVNTCLGGGPAGNPDDPKDPLHRPYYRGCMKTAGVTGTQWRRSDPTICASIMRLAECGCGLDLDGNGAADADIDLGQALVPTQPEAPVSLRGFPLGTWAGIDRLPAGCRHQPTGDPQQTIVTCDLTAAEVLASRNDLKGACRTKYADNVVVHIPVPADKIVCTPPTDTQYGPLCGPRPWTLVDSTAGGSSL